MRGQRDPPSCLRSECSDFLCRTKLVEDVTIPCWVDDEKTKFYAIASASMYFFFSGIFRVLILTRSTRILNHIGYEIFF